MAGRKKQSAESAVREIRRRTRRKFAPEEKIRIVLEGLRGEQSISELCRREDIAANSYSRWSKDFHINRCGPSCVGLSDSNPGPSCSELSGTGPDGSISPSPTGSSCSRPCGPFARIEMGRGRSSDSIHQWRPEP